MRHAQLGDVAEFVRGISFKPADVVEVGTAGAVPCLRTKNVQSSLDLEDLYYVAAGFVKRDEQFLQPGDVLISSANSWNLLGKCSWVPDLDQRSTFGGFVTVLRPLGGAVDRRYLFRWFSYDRTQQLLRSFGRKTTNISNLPLDRCRQMEIPLPSMEEQRRIAAVLDAADELRAKRRRAIAKLDTLAQSIFIDMFGDPVANPRGWADEGFEGALAVLKYGPRFYNESYSDIGTPMIRITDVADDGSLDFDGMPRMDLDEEERAKYLLQEGDIIFARSGSVGRTALIGPAVPECIAGAYFVWMRFKPEYLPEYVLAVLRSESIKQTISTKSRQVAQPNFSGPAIRRLPLPRPPSGLQARFRERTTAVATEAHRHRRALASADVLFSSLQQRAFAGEL